ncbi:MAG: hypothetical protein U0790_19225 [Isosphaeraceae bacterium]
MDRPGHDPVGDRGSCAAASIWPGGGRAGDRGDAWELQDQSGTDLLKPRMLEFAGLPQLGKSI